MLYTYQFLSLSSEDEVFNDGGDFTAEPLDMRLRGREERERETEGEACKGEKGI